MSDILKIKNLKVEGRPPGGEYVSIVKNVSLNVGKGEVLALIGESGSGKSTISLASMGFARPGCRIAEGEVWLNGRDIMALSPRERHALRGDEVSYVAQSAAASFNPALRIGKQVIEAPLWHDAGDQATLTANAIDLYRKLDLPNPEAVGEKFPHQVSGGQLQRLMTAMAMSCGPDLLILDEPTTALDVTTQIEVLKAFKDIIRDQGTAAVYVTHDLAVVAQVADRILVLKNGEMVEEGSTDQILHDPQHEYTRTLMAAVRPAPHLVAHVDAVKAQAPVVSVRNVTAGYGALTILSDVSIEVPAASVTGVIGESGCGKSTLARVIAGLTPLRSGEITLDGKAAAPKVKDRPREALKDCQIVFQMADTALNPRQKISDILGRPLAFYQGLKERERADRVAELLELVDLPRSFASRYPGELSGGQKQRINLARALAADPKVILCDEVTSALDTVVAAGVIELLKSLKEKLGVAYVFISHDLSTVASFADEVVVLYAGRVVEKGPSMAVFSPPFHPYTKLLLSSVPEMRQGWLEGVADSSEAQAASAGSVVIGAKGCPFANRCAFAIAGTCERTPPPVHNLPGGLQIACHLSVNELR